MEKQKTKESTAKIAKNSIFPVVAKNTMKKINRVKKMVRKKLIILLKKSILHWLK